MFLRNILGGKSPKKLLLCITVEAGKVGDYRSYYRLMYSASAPAHTPAQPDYKRQPMRWYPLRMITKATLVLYPAPAAASSLAEYSKGEQYPMQCKPLRSGIPCGMVSLAEMVSPAEWVTVEKPGAVSLRPALTPGLRRESPTSFRLITETGHLP